MRKGRKELLVIGDRVLVEPEEAEGQTKVGLVLPASVVEKEDVRGGKVVAMGPGVPLPPPADDTEPWKTPDALPRFMPMQVAEGDHVLFFRKAAIEISFEEQKYLVVPHSAILVLVREDAVPDELPDEL